MNWNHFAQKLLKCLVRIKTITRLLKSKEKHCTKENEHKNELSEGF